MKAWRTPLLTLLVGLAFASAQGVGNEAAPDFLLLDAGSEPVRLSDFAGTPVLLNFWATWCPPYREELPLFQRVADETGEGELQVLLVNNNEGPERALPFLEAEGIRLMTALDATREQRERLAGQGLAPDSTLEVMRRYRVRGMPTTVFIDADGIIQGIWVGLISPAQTTERLAGIGVLWEP